jgi:predicted transcriptional regulator
MFFWGLHANGRFDDSTICYALDNDISVVGKELQNLVDAGIIEKEVDNGVNSYYLTFNEAKRRLIVEWASPGHTGR